MYMNMVVGMRVMQGAWGPFDDDFDPEMEIGNLLQVLWNWLQVIIEKYRGDSVRFVLDLVK